jgi:hypothetical protein
MGSFTEVIHQAPARSRPTAQLRVLGDFAHRQVRRLHGGTAGRCCCRQTSWTRKPGFVQPQSWRGARAHTDQSTAVAEDRWTMTNETRTKTRRLHPSTARIAIETSEPRIR